MAMDRETQLLQAATSAGITSQKELANFMAQVGHESGGLTRLEEGFRYTKGIWQIPVKSAMREGKEALEDARLEALQGKPEKLAELMYGGRMGNDEPGDGYRFHGRGYMQLTGKDNYRAAGQALGLDLLKHPELAAEPENAAKIATWYWESRVPQSARENITKSTHAINGGENGLPDRQARYEKWEKALTPELSIGTMGGRGPDGAGDYAQHVHYQLKDSAGTLKSPEDFWNKQQVVAVTNQASRATEPGAQVASGDVIKHSEKGESIRQLQDTLNNYGYRDKDGRALREDGHFGDRTKEALQAYQQAHGLKVDGVVGPETLEALRKSQAAPLLSDPRHPDNILFQQALKGLEQLVPQAFKNRRELESSAGAMVFEAKASGLARIDHVLQSTNGTGLFAVQGALNDPAHRRIHLGMMQAAAEPIEKSTVQVRQEIPAAIYAPQQEHEQRRPMGV